MESGREMQSERETRNFEILGQGSEAVCPTVMRTPDKCFEGVCDWPYEPRYVTGLAGYSGMQMHFVDIADANAKRTALCIHGQRTWGFAFRKAVRHLAGYGYRIIIPDLFGFGRSDKPSCVDLYSFEFHRTSIIRLIEELGLGELCLVGFGWGGWISATLPMDMEDRIAGLLLGNALIHTPGNEPWPGFHVWRSMHNAQVDPAVSPVLRAENNVVRGGVARAYDAPFPDSRYKAGIRAFPNLVPLSAEHRTTAVTLRAKQFLSEEWTGKSAIIASDCKIMGHEAMKSVHATIRNAPEMIRVSDRGPLVFEHADQFMPDALEYLI